MLSPTPRAPRRIVERFNFWFEATQDRAQQWFATQTQIWTIVFAIAAAFVFQLDTVEIYSKISTSRTMRDKLVANAAAFTANAEKTLADSTTLTSYGLKFSRD